MSKTETPAEQIADVLFTNGNGDIGYSLVMMDRNNHDIGGWSRRAVVQQINKVLHPTPTPITAEGLREAGEWKDCGGDGFVFEMGCYSTERGIKGGWDFFVNGRRICQVHSMEQLASLLAAIRGPGE